MQTGFKPVYAKISRYILLIEFKTYIYKHQGEVRGKNRKNQKPYGESFEHVYV
jgi:hypothetical protein